MKRILTVHVDRIVLFFGGLVVVLWADTYFDPPVIVSLPAFLFYGLASGVLIPATSVRYE